MAAIDSVHQFAASIANLSQAEQNQQLRDFILTIPQFNDAGIEEETQTVWATFTDGVSFVNFPARPRRTSESNLPSGVLASAAPRSGVASPGVLGFDPSQLDMYPYPGTYPLMRKVVLDYAYDDNPDSDVNNTAKFAKWFRDRGYDASAGTASVDELLAFEGQALAVYYFNGHSALRPVKGGGRVAILGSSTPVSTANNAKYKSLIDEGYLGYANFPGYTLEESFLAKYLKFGPGALVVLDSCFSSQKEFRSLMQDTLQVDLYGGWPGLNLPDDSESAMILFFSRILGHAATEGEEAPSRAFPIAEIYDYLVTSSLGGSFTIKRRENATLNHLVPGIEDMVPSEHAKRLKLAGDFGLDPGEDKRSVRIGDQPVKVTSWDGDFIDVEMPPIGGPGGFGPVVVQAEGIESNKIPLAALTGSFDVERKGEVTQQCSLHVDLAFRADPHPFRMDPEAELRYRHFSADPSSATKGTLSCSGNNKTPAHCTEGGPTIWQEWSGSQTLTSKGEAKGVVAANVMYLPRLLQSKLTVQANAVIAVTDHKCDGTSSAHGGGFTLGDMYDPIVPVPFPGPGATDEERASFSLSVTPWIQCRPRSRRERGGGFQQRIKNRAADSTIPGRQFCDLVGSEVERYNFARRAAIA